MTIESCDRGLVEELETFVKPETVPAPLFGLFEVAVMHWQTEDPAIAHDDLVQVVGMAWNPTYSNIAGWWYHVRYLYAPVGGHLSAGHQEDCSEADLRKWEVVAGAD